MPGEPLPGKFQGMNDAEKAVILGQMADVLACFQRHELPDSVKEYGGLNFDASGRFVAGPLSTVNIGPFDTYQALVRGMIQAKLLKADDDPNVRGWRDNGIRSRLNSFVESRIQDLTDGMGKPGKTLVHGDLSKSTLFIPTLAGHMLEAD